MNKNSSAIEQYLQSLHPSFKMEVQGDSLWSSPYINYTIGEDQNNPIGQFLLQIRLVENARNDLDLIAITMWAQDLNDSWINDKAEIVSLLINRINNQMQLGGFWIDLEDGGVAFNASLFVQLDSVSASMVSTNIDSIADTINEYYPSIVECISSNVE
jgi:hypothetical protein